MPFQDWWPYDPVPHIPTLGPIAVYLEGRRKYFYCVCGRSKVQPWCDGNSHKGTGLKPYFFEIAEEETAIKRMCGCKMSKGFICDYACLAIRCNRNMPLGCLAFFFSSAAVSYVFTWFFHP
eukprot:Platyproteum_vivax@DN3429_c0_g1_i1.p1